MSTARRSILFAGGSPALVYNDEFISTIVAPIPAGSADGRGYRVVNDTESLMSIGSGVLNVPAQVSAVWGDEYYRAQPNSGQQYWTRPSGKALVAIVDFRHSTRNQQNPVGWWNSATLDAVAGTLGIYTASNVIRARSSGNNISDDQAYTVDTDYLGVAVWDSTGFHTFAKISGIWHRKWFTPSSVTQAYCGMSNLTSVGSLKYFRIYAIDETLFAPALSITAPSVGNLANMPDGDFLLYLDNITRPSAGDMFLRVKKKNASDYWRFKPANSGGGATVDEFVNGGGTNRISGSGVVSTDDLILIARAQSMAVWRNTTALGSSYPTAYNWLREVGLEITHLEGSSSIANLYAWKARLLDETGLGANSVVNGDFATDTNWIKDPEWTISGGTANKAAGASTRSISQTVGTLTIGKYYKITFTVLNYVAGTLTLFIGATGAVAPVSANGTYTVYGVCAGDTKIYLQGNAASNLSLDGVSSEEITFTADALALILDGLAS